MYMKVNDNVKVNQDNNNINKENLYQRFSLKEPNKNIEKPVKIIFFIFKKISFFYNFYFNCFNLETIEYPY